ncbi:PAS domain S-box protein [Nocardioides sp.]|uniref:sensor histidine kinase n=1 Tax=Nocardioides sp. TaxID=35761 RepID=UPI00273401D2|nr:PAS domain S-box protein [Nocardioides sp.]MDP3893430.1 PAS domain S-box protein [Nocardioides sp.]
MVPFPDADHGSADPFPAGEASTHSGLDTADLRAQTLQVLARAGDHPLMRSFQHGAVFIFDEDLRYLSVNGSGLAAVGLSRKGLEGKTLFEAFPTDTTGIVEPWFRGVLEGRSSTVDVPFAGRIFSQRLTPIFDEAGEIVAGMGIAQDVTEARAAGRARLESEERFRLSFVHAPIGKAVVELNGRLRQVNTAFTKLTQYSEKELLTRSFQDITHPDDLDADLEHLGRLLAGEVDSYTMEKRYITGAGSTVWALLSVTLVREQGGTPLYFIAQIQDTTERKAQEAALHDMVAMLSHDLRSPVSVVTGYAEMALDAWDSLRDSERRDFVLKISAAAHSVQALLEDTLTSAALDAQGVLAHPVPVRLDEVVHETLETLNSAPSVVVSHTGDPTAVVDRGHLTQILANLITNALKYGASPVAIDIRPRADWMVVEVSDAGHGVPQEFEPHLFDRFTRSQDAQSGRERGSGLGLYIVRRLLTLNGGEVWYTPTPGGGATFAFQLPRVAPH